MLLVLDALVAWTSSSVSHAQFPMCSSFRCAPVYAQFAMRAGFRCVLVSHAQFLIPMLVCS